MDCYYHPNRESNLKKADHSLKISFSLLSIIETHPLRMCIPSEGPKTGYMEMDCGTKVSRVRVRQMKLNKDSRIRSMLYARYTGVGGANKGTQLQNGVTCTSN